MNGPTTPIPGAAWVLLALIGLLLLWSWARPRRPAKPRHHVVSWRVLWWRKAAPPDAVRRELAPMERQFTDQSGLIRYFNQQADADAEEGDHAGHR